MPRAQEVSKLAFRFSVYLKVKGLLVFTHSFGINIRDFSHLLAVILHLIARHALFALETSRVGGSRGTRLAFPVKVWFIALSRLVKRGKATLFGSLQL